jgi:tryptophan halogenase
VSTARELPRRVVVAGAGQVGALAAIALRRALPQSEVLVVGTPLDPARLPIRAPTALPFTNRLHDRLGIAEERLVREAGGSHRLVVANRVGAGERHQGAAPYGLRDRPSPQDPLSRADWAGARATLRTRRARTRSENCSPPRGASSRRAEA